jgi:uncharacterized protein with HEPN domain
MKKRDDVYISQIQDRIARVKTYLKGISQTRFMKSDLHKSAVIRELEVIGEAARLISIETKQNFPTIPWPQMVGMRNRLIHEYFSVDESVVWEVAYKQLPSLEKEFEKAFLRTSPPVHPWRNCPLGYYFVKEFDRKVKISANRPEGLTSVQPHCRKNPSGKDQLYPAEMLLIATAAPIEKLLKDIGRFDAPKNANDFDQLIAVWTQYWNDIFAPSDKLQPNIVKALLFSESSFNLSVKDVRIRTGNYARGPMQITDETRKILGDEKGELKDHFVTLTASDVRRPEFAIPAAIRWLFYKRERASRYLGREASWDEAVAHYKAYLKKSGDLKTHKGMKNFFGAIDKLQKGSQK